MEILQYNNVSYHLLGDLQYPGLCYIIYIYYPINSSQLFEMSEEQGFQI